MSLLPSLSFGLSTGIGADSGNQNVNFGNADSLPASFWGTPAVKGGTSIVPGTGATYSFAGIAMMVGVGIAIYLLARKL